MRQLVDFLAGLCLVIVLPCITMWAVAFTLLAIFKFLDYLWVVLC